MILRMIGMLVLVALIFGGIFAFKAYQGKMMAQYMASMGAPAQTVSTAKAESQEWQQTFEAVGSLRAVKGVDISPEVSGIVEAINFDSGDDVKAGTVMVQLRAEDDIAKLGALQAAANLAKTNYDRDVKQLKVQAVSREVVDTDRAALQSAEAQVKEQQAVIDKKTIKAPFDGHLGIRQVDLGQYVNPGAPVVTLQALDPMYVDFYLPQQALSRIKIGQKVVLKNDTWPGRTFEGEIAVINPKVDSDTRNVQLRATVSNTDRALLPGMYATVDIVTGAPAMHITLPQTAITYNPYGNVVYLVVADGMDAKGQPKLTAKQTFVTTGEARGDQVQILTGVNEGDEVVTSGQIKLRNGAPITVNNAVVPTNDANPAPAEK